nr:MADS-box protein SOC1 isoform A [Ipomoea batatas]
MVPTWVRLVDLPDKCWKPEALSKIASCLGNPICMDYNTKLAKKRDFARMLVEIDSSIPPIESIPILLPSGETIHQAVYFEQYPCFCVNCKSSKHWVENCPKLKGIPQADSAFPPLKIIDCKRNGNEWRWNKEDISPESVEPETVEKPADGPSDGDLLESQVVVSPSEPAEPSAPADCVDIGANPTPTDEVCEAEQVNTMDGNVQEDQTDSSLAESDSKSDEQVVSPSNLTVIPATAAALEGCEDEVEVIPRTPSMSSPSSRARIQWDEVPNFMPLFTTHLPSFGPFAFDKELIAYQLKANKAHEEFVAFQKEANRVCKEFVAMKKGISETLSPVKSVVGSPSKPFDFRAALLSPTTSQGDKVCNSSKAVSTPLRVISLSRGKGRKRPGAAVK